MRASIGWIYIQSSTLAIWNASEKKKERSVCVAHSGTIKVAVIVVFFSLLFSSPLLLLLLSWQTILFREYYYMYTCIWCVFVCLSIFAFDFPFIFRCLFLSFSPLHFTLMRDLSFFLHNLFAFYWILFGFLPLNRLKINIECLHDCLFICFVTSRDVIFTLKLVTYQHGCISSRKY